VTRTLPVLARANRTPRGCLTARPWRAVSSMINGKANAGKSGGGRGGEGGGGFKLCRYSALSSVGIVLPDLRITRY